MPQMAPISWLSLFIIFIVTFIFFNVKNYFIYTPLMPKSSSKKLKTNNFNWKW